MINGSVEIAWAYELNDIGFQGRPLFAKQEWLKKKQDPGELSYTDLIASLNKPINVNEIMDNNQ